MTKAVTNYSHHVFSKVATLVAAALAVASVVDIHAQAPAADATRLPLEFSMSTSLGQGVSFSPVDLHFPLTEKTALTAALTLGGTMRTQRLNTELSTFELTKLRYRTNGNLRVGIRQYANAVQEGFYFGGGLSAGSHTVRATTRAPRNPFGFFEVLLLPLAVIDRLQAINHVNTSALHVGGHAGLGYAYKTRFGKRQEFGVRFDFVPAQSLRYNAADASPDGQPLTPTRTLSDDFAAGGLGLQAVYRFEL